MSKRAVVIAAVTVFIFVAGCADLQQAVMEDKRSREAAACIYEVFQAEQGDYPADEFNAKMYTTIEVLRKRLGQKGCSGAAVFQQGTNSIRIELPEALLDKGIVPDKVFQSVTVRGVLEFKNAAGETMLTGADVEQAYAAADNDQTTGITEYVVALRFSSEGAEKFAQLTEEAYKNNTDITITLDGKEISIAGVSEPVYGGNAIIKGSFTAEEAQNLAIQIESGAMPLQLELIDSGTGISEDPR